jgi:hypothetical protein
MDKVPYSFRVIQVRRADLKRTLPADKRRELVKDIRLAPVWMHPIFRELAKDEAQLPLLHPLPLDFLGKK